MAAITLRSRKTGETGEPISILDSENCDHLLDICPTCVSHWANFFDPVSIALLVETGVIVITVSEWGQIEWSTER